MTHVIDLGRNANGTQWQPFCSCGWRRPEPTRWASLAQADANVHLTAVGAKTIPGQRETWARRYMGQRGSVA
jgi:hypothetical protein